MINNTDLTKLVKNFINEDVPPQTKKETLTSWLDQIVAKHDGMIMDKTMAKHYSESLRIVESAINTAVNGA